MEVLLVTSSSVNEVKTLKHLCLSVLKNFRLWLKEFIQYRNGKGSGHIPPRLMCDILEAVNSSLLEIMSTRHLMGDEKTQHKLMREVFRDPPQSFLHLSECDVKTSMMRMFIPALPNLLHVQITHCKFSDDSLLAFGDYLHHLEELDLTGCKSITDIGVKNLCLGRKSGWQYTYSRARCQKLRRMILEKTKVTVEGLKVALTNLSRLTELKHEKNGMAVASFAKWNADSLPRFHLERLCCFTNGHQREDMVQMCIMACPKIKAVEFRVGYNIPSTFFLPLMELTDLAHLSIEFDDHEQVNPHLFSDSIVPILKHLRHNLISLTLKEVPAVQMDLIGRYCRALESLTFVSAGVSDDHWSWLSELRLDPIETPFQVLNWVEYTASQYNFDAVAEMSDIKCLLSAKSLYHICLRGTSTLTDALLQESLDDNRFLKLKEVELINCKNITVSFVFTLLRYTHGTLHLLGLKFCGISSPDIQEIEDLIDRHGWGVFFYM